MTTPPPAAGLMLIHGNDLGELRELLLNWLQRHPSAPLETETVLVQSNGMADWLRLGVAANCGIAACMKCELPAAFLWRVYRQVLGRSEVPEKSPFDKDQLVWRLMRLLPELLEQPAFAPLKGFLAADADLRKRFQLASQLADLLDQYQVYRADWLEAWAGGRDEMPAATGQPEPLPEAQRWQGALWRALLDDVAGAGADCAVTRGRAAVHEAFLRRAAAWGIDEAPPAGLPPRVVVFGISALPRQWFEVLHALSRWTQVIVCVHNPCRHHWADIVPDKVLLRATRHRHQRRAGMPGVLAEEDLHQHAHPLLAAWGRQGRDYIGLLDEYDSAEDRARYQSLFERIDLFDSPGQGCLLKQLQDDIMELRPLHESRQHWLATPVKPDDDSIRFHVAHSAQREVEALHDHLLAAFAADPGLKPQDVIVMVPDVDAYAPHIQAVFGLVEESDARFIPFRIADQGRRSNDPLLEALAQLLELPRARVAVSDVLGLLEVPALRRRFGIAEDEVPRLQRWIAGANVRWGLHAEHRRSLELPDADAVNTWLFGLRRMLLGYAVGGPAEAWHDIEPYDEIGGLDAALLGPLASLFDRLEATWRTLRADATPVDWCSRLHDLLEDYFDGGAGASSGDRETLLELGQALDRWGESCKAAGLREPLPLSVVSEHWLAQVEERSLSQRFLAGVVTFASLMPMRSIPFRHVCLLGMNDGDYPRSRVPMDFDLMRQRYRPGDRSRREDDRYLFLEALLSARDRLLVSWVGRSIQDNSERPPSVLAGQLRDHLSAGWRLQGLEHDPKALLQALTVEHRLQPFSPAYFPVQDNGRLFTYAHEWRDRPGHGDACGATLDAMRREEPLTLSELVDFLRYPVKSFFRTRLKVHFDAADAAASEDQEPFDLDKLAQWKLQDELIAAQAHAYRTGGSLQATLQTALARLKGRGVLPARAVGDLVAEELAEPMDDLFKRYDKAVQRWPVAVEGDEEIRYRDEATGLTIDDRLHDLRTSQDGGERARVVLESRSALKEDHYNHENLIRHWVAHLAAHLGGKPLTTVIVSKAGDVQFEPLDPEAARAHVSHLLHAWQDGMCRPLPLAVKTGFARLKDIDDGAKSKNGAVETFEGSDFRKDNQAKGEVEACPYLQRTWPDYAALSASGEFDRLAEELLRPLYVATPVTKTKRQEAEDAARHTKPKPKSKPKAAAKAAKASKARCAEEQS